MRTLYFIDGHPMDPTGLVHQNPKLAFDFVDL